MIRKVERARALRRLKEDAKDRLPKDLPEDERDEVAKSVLDEEVGPDWRQDEDITSEPAQVIVVMQAPGADEEYLNRVKSALGGPGKPGHHPEQLDHDNPGKILLKIRALLGEFK